MAGVQARRHSQPQQANNNHADNNNTFQPNEAETLLWPYRTTPLVLPGAKVKREVPTTSYLRHHPNPAMRAGPQHYDPNLEVLMKQKVADTVLERVAGPDASKKAFSKQFNSPIGLYSEQNISESVQAQTGVTPIFIDLSFLKQKQQPPPPPPQQKPSFIRHF
ncbi:Hypothetical predicted protein [Cloeon dipterum]|uniref:Zasp-like motif domain-containing protein n=1 Tax=Cloeon dipterum TaxID=197152 RepID=A0A8S1DEG6_9INSE|nr:Hypothetical predicted protein [Cloeon dipterum]